MVGYGRLLLSVLGVAHFKWELHVERLVMTTFKLTSLTPGRDPTRCLILSRLFVLWTVLGSLFFVLTILTS